MHRDTRVANYLLVILVSLSLAMMALPLSVPVRAVKACLAYALVPEAYYGSKGVERLAQVPANVRRLMAADMENRAMREEMRRWALVRSEADALRSENERLRASLGLRGAPGRVPRWARILERDPLQWFHSVMVDAGADDGIRLNDPVLGPVGGRLVAVGRVVETGARHSKVLLLSDELSSVAAKLSTGAVEGLVQGQGGERLRMSYIPSEAVPAVGDEVLTSATSATFPADIRIGTVSRVHARDQFLTFLSVEVRPDAAPAALTEVVVLLPETRLAPPGSHGR